MNLTAEAIRQRLGCSTVAMPGNAAIGAKDMAKIAEAGITRVEICGLYWPMCYDYHNRAQVREIIDECRQQGISIVAVHGPGLPYDSPYEAVRRGVVEEAVASATVAVEMGASIFVAHFNTSDRAERTVCDMLEQLDGSDIVLAVENLPGAPDLSACRAIVERVDSDRFGMALDIGHPRDPDGLNPFVKPGRASEEIALCEGRLVHVHLHDFVETDHYAPFDGDIRWDETLDGLDEIGYAGELMFEALPRVSIEDTLKKTAAFPDEFTSRYGRS